MFVKEYNQDYFYNLDFIEYIEIENHPGLDPQYLAVAFILIGTCLQRRVIGAFDHYEEALEYVQTLS